MTEIRTVGSSSSGNGYIIKSGNDILIIELGCKLERYFEMMSFAEMIQVRGCVVSHRHSDHLNQSTAKEMMRRGVPVFVGEKVYEDILKEGVLTQIKPLPANQRSYIGGFVIQPFEVPHNATNYGFIITTPDKDRILFLTDTTGINYRFKDINCIMVECNHDDETMIDNLDRHEVGNSHPEFHLGLQECCDFCKHNISSSTKKIILLHLSHENINEMYALGTVRAETGFDQVSAAHKGEMFVIHNDNF